jgi:F420-non-reducing hydrogenase small subunit
MSKLTRIPSKDIVKEIERTAKSHYSYTMATKMIGEKPTFLIKRWVAEADQDYEGARYDRS